MYIAKMIRYSIILNIGREFTFEAAAYVESKVDQQLVRGAPDFKISKEDIGSVEG